MATVPRTADLPSWARGLNAYEAETSLGRDTPEEAFGFKASGTTGRPGMIKGSSKTQDMAATRAFRNRTSPGGAYPSNADLNNKFRAQDDQAKMSRAGMWDNFVRSNRPPMHGEMRKGSDGQMWKYNAATGHGEPAQGAAPAATAGASASIGTASSVPVTTTPLSGSTQLAVSSQPALMGPRAPGMMKDEAGNPTTMFDWSQKAKIRQKQPGAFDPQVQKFKATLDQKYPTGSGGAGSGTTGPKQSGSGAGGTDDQFQQRLNASMTIGNNAKPYSSTRVGGAIPMGKRPKWAA